MRIEIYSLRHPDTGEIRYIGKANDSKKRLKSHIRDARRRNTPVYCWIRSLSSLPVIQVEAIAISEDWQSLEKSIISQYKTDGARLLNVAEGGDEPYCSTETRLSNGKRMNAGLLIGYRAALIRLGKDNRLMDKLGNHDLAESGRKIAAMLRGKSPQEKKEFNDRIIARSPVWLKEYV